MRRIVFAFLALLIASSGAEAASTTYAATLGSGAGFAAWCIGGTGASCSGGAFWPGTVIANSAGAELFTSGNAGYVQFPSAQPISAASLPLPTGAATAANQTATQPRNLAQMGGTAIASGCTAALSGFSTSIPSTICPVMGAYVLNTNANVANNADGVAAGATAGSPVVNYNYAFNGSTWDRLQDDANKNLKIAPQAFPAGGWTPKWFIAANTDNATNLKASGGTVHAVEVYGIGSAPAYLKFYNKASTPTCGTDTIVKQIMIPAASTAANGAGSNAIVLDTAFTTGISYCVVTGIGATDDTSPAASTFIVNIDWN